MSLGTLHGRLLRLTSASARAVATVSRRQVMAMAPPTVASAFEQTRCACSGSRRHYATSSRGTGRGGDQQDDQSNERAMGEPGSLFRSASSEGNGLGQPPPPSSSPGASYEPLPTPPRHPASSSASPSSAMGASSANGAHTASMRVAYPPSGLELPESSFLKCIEKEMMDEKYRLDKEAGPPAMPSGWEFHHPEGTSLIYGRCTWRPEQPPEPPLRLSDIEDASENTATTDSAAEEAAPRNTPATAAHPRLVEQHYVRVQLTTRDASLDPECDVRGEHFPFSFFVTLVEETPAAEISSATETNAKSGPREVRNDVHADESSTSTSAAAWVRDLDGSEGLAAADGSDASPLYRNSIEVRCDVIDGELVVDNVLCHGTFNAYGHAARRRRQEEAEAAARGTEVSMVLNNNPFGGYAGPNLDEAEEEILDGVQAWLAERRIDDLFGEFIGQYSIWVEQAEYERWLQQLHDYVAA